MSLRFDSTQIPALPITEHLEAISEGVRNHSTSIIQAPPGSGKTTVLPLYLATQPWLNGKGVLVLQPRRLAAKSVAMRMAELVQESVGQSVGYQVRLESKRSRETRIEVITEGLLTRRLVSDPELSGVGLVIFDEFHERSIHADLGLALTREVLAVLRPDLRIVVMSATLGSLLNAESFSNAWRYSFDSSPHPVAVHYTIPEPRRRVWEVVAQSVRGALEQHTGDILAFLPGASEIERCRELLTDHRLRATVLPLYGELPYEQQKEAIAPGKTDARRVILATPIAETSLTIDGVRVVIDSGLHKVARSDEAGITSLSTERITLDSAEQRAGRAGRTAPGVCIRLWSEQEHKTLRPAREPEILRSDLAQPLLELYAWGVREPSTFGWITPPPARALREAQQTLTHLGALGCDGSITQRGRELVSLGTHPRIAAMCLASRAANLEGYAAAIIPLLEERLPPSFLRHGANLQPLVEELSEQSKRVPSHLANLYRRWLSRIESLPKGDPSSARVTCAPNYLTGYLLACAFPERIARRRSESLERYLMASGKGVALRTGDPLTSHEFLVVASLQSRDDDSVVSLAAPFDPLLLDSALQHLVSTHETMEFNERRGALIPSRQVRIGAVVLREERPERPSCDELNAALEGYLRSAAGHARIPFTLASRQLQARAAWAASIAPDVGLPDISDAGLSGSSPFWLSGYLPDNGALASLSEERVEQALRACFSWNVLRELESLAPETFQLPNGRTRRISYEASEGPVIEATIQELFGLQQTPRIGRKQIRATIHLLSPARRPMQVTQDLESFWKNIYPEVRKELRGRYPKHRWPEDPTQKEQLREKK